MKKKAPVAAAAKKKIKQPRVKLPKFGWTVEEWFEPFRSDDVIEPIILGLNIPLQVIDPTPEEMSRRNIPRPFIPTKTTNPTRSRSSIEQQHQQKEKRQKTSADAPQPSISQATHLEDSRATTPKEQEKVPNPQVDTNEPPTEAVIRREFSPSYTSSDNRVLLLQDSIKEEPSLAVTLLKGLALSRYIDQVPADLLPGLREMCSHLVQIHLLT